MTENIEKHYAWKCSTCSRGERESDWQNAEKSGRRHKKENPGHEVIVESSRKLVLETA